MTSAYTIRRNVRVPMRDGVELATDVYVPDGDGPFPTLLQRTPYDRSDPFGTQYILQLTIVRALDAGLAVVIQDTRGRCGSGGVFEPFVNESDDGVDAVGWIVEQDFSDGRVATYGASYVGATQWLVAMNGVVEHVAMAPFLTTADYHRWMYRHGALQLGFVALWITESLAPVDVEMRQLAADDRARATLARLLSDPGQAMCRLPIFDEQLVELAPYLADWLQNPTADRWWPAIAPIAHVDMIGTPALHIAGFNDLFLAGSLHAYDTLRRHGATAAVRDGQYLVIGPWSHGNVGDWQGEQWLGHSAAAAALDLTAVQLEFFAAVFAGRQPDLPRVRYFTSGVNTWQSADEWPPPADMTAFYLAAEGNLVAACPPDAHTDRYVSDTLDPVPTIGGATFLPGILVNRNDGPRDQAAVERRDDVLVYRSPVLEANVEVTGDVVVELWASSSALDCDWNVRLVDIDGDGRSVGIVDDVVRARYRRGDQPTPLTPGVPELFVIELGSISHEFAAGHRIGLQVASSNFPRFDRNPQSMVDPVRATVDDFVPANQTVFGGGDRPSRLLLPLAAER